MKGLASGSRGFALPLVVMATAILLVLAAGFLALATRERQGARDQINLTRALYLADAGVELALQNLEDRGFSWFDFTESFGDGETVRVSLTAGEAGADSDEAWHFAAEGEIQDEEGRMLAKRIIKATVKKGFLPEQFAFGSNPGEHLVLGEAEESEEMIFFRRGDLTLESIGPFRGNYIIAVDGTVTVQGDCIPVDPGGSLVIISSRKVVLDGGTIWAVIFTPTLVFNNYTTLLGKTVCGTAIYSSGAFHMSDGSTGTFIANSLALVEERAAYRPVLVKWRELYPVF